MEIHRHSQTKRQKWTHYFWEFFMLFLAVVTGFFVENQREHYIEHQRARQYARALYHDLVSDTAILASNIRTIREIMQSQEKMNSLMRQRDTARVPGAMLYYYAARSEAGTFFTVKTATLEQLKNSGSLRYFKSFELVRLVNEYDQALKNQFGRTDVDMAYNSEYRGAYKEMFDFREHDRLDMLLFLYPQSRDSVLALDLPLLSSGNKETSNFMHSLQNRRYNLSRRVEKYYSDPLEAAMKLIDALKNEYHFN